MFGFLKPGKTTKADVIFAVAAAIAAAVKLTDTVRNYRNDNTEETS